MENYSLKLYDNPKHLYVLWEFLLHKLVRLKKNFVIYKKMFHFRH